MKILFDNVENQEGTIYVSLDDGASYNQYELKNVWATGIEIPDDTDFSKVKIKARAEIFKNLFVVSGMKTLATYKIDFDIEKEMISYYKKTEVDSKLSSLTSSVNTSIDNINNTLNKSVLNVKASDEAGYITVLYNNGESNKIEVGSSTVTTNQSTGNNILLSISSAATLVAPKKVGQLAYIQNTSSDNSIKITYNSSSTITIPAGGLEIFVSKGTSWVPFKLSQIYIS